MAVTEEAVTATVTVGADMEVVVAMVRAVVALGQGKVEA